MELELLSIAAIAVIPKLLLSVTQLITGPFEYFKRNRRESLALLNSAIKNLNSDNVRDQFAGTSEFNFALKTKLIKPEITYALDNEWNEHQIKCFSKYKKLADLSLEETNIAIKNSEKPHTKATKIPSKYIRTLVIYFLSGLAAKFIADGADIYSASSYQPERLPITIVAITCVCVSLFVALICLIEMTKHAGAKNNIKEILNIQWKATIRTPKNQ